MSIGKNNLIDTGELNEADIVEVDEKILLVDDEPNLLSALKRQLKGHFAITTAQSGLKALEKVEKEGPFSVIVCDMCMPGMYGTELLQRLQILSPDTVRIMLTGDAQQQTAIKAINEGHVFNFLTKPCPTNALVDSIETAIKQYQLVVNSRKMHAETKRLALTDQLTGLANRYQFNERFKQSLLLAQRERKKIALLYLDLDKFKPINDTFGHPVGDAVLQNVAARLTKQCRETDVIARLGGDEFAILLVHPDCEENIERVASRIIVELRKPMDALGKEVILGASIGVSVFPRDGNTEDMLIQNADLALYEAKSLGRNCCRFYRLELRDWSCP